VHRYTRRELFRKLGDVITRGSVSALLAADAAERLTWRPSFWERWPLLDAILRRILGLLGR
jgi:hypothetical protein